MTGGQGADPAGGGAAFPADRAAEAAAADASMRRGRGPRLQWPLAVVLGGLLVSLLIVASDHFRRGSVLFAGFVGLAFLLRLLLPERRVGWLAVRSRPVDLLVIGSLGLALTVFSLIVPPPS